MSILALPGLHSRRGVSAFPNMIVFGFQGNALNNS